MKGDTFKLEIITPDKRFLEKDVTFLVLPEPDGEIGILPNHIPLVASLDPGVLSYKDEADKSFKIAIGGGFMKFDHNQARVLAETAETADDIDLERAKRARDRAAERLEKREANFNQNRAEMALKRSIARIKVAESLSN
jgi:F-type H+-transporting ATPase subunit epsilon